ncbi:MAG: apolipoprotein N-acyltransferase [bacterium]
MAINIIFHILIPVLFFLSFQIKSAGISFIAIYAFMLYFLSARIENKKTFRSTFIIFFLFWLMMLNWLLVINVNLTPLQRVLIGIGWIFLSALMGLVWSVPFSFISIKNREIYLLPVALSAVEYLLSSTRDLSFLWVTPSTAVIDYPVFIQTADLGGSYLVSLLVIMFAVILFRLFSIKRDTFDKMLFAILLFSVIIYGSIRISEDYEGERINVTVVQPNIPGEMKESYREFIEFRFNSIKENLKKAESQDGELVIFPETASPVYLSKNSNNQIKQYLQDFTDSTGKSILIGGLTYEYGEKRNNDRYFNSAFYFSRGETIQTYHKIRCVPFVERMPYEEKLKFLRKIDYGQGGYSVGAKQTILDSAGSRISAYICFESIFPTYVSSFAKNGAKLLVNISEDAWFIKGIGAKQHFQAGILRAVENRRWLVRSSNPGYSAVIDPTGRIIYRTVLNTAEVFTEEVVLIDKLTFFASSGNLLPKLFLITALLTLIVKILRRKNDKSKIENSA